MEANFIAIVLIISFLPVDAPPGLKTQIFVFRIVHASSSKTAKKRRLLKALKLTQFSLGSIYFR